MFIYTRATVYLMSGIKKFLFLAPFLGVPALHAAEFEVLDKLSVDGYTVLRGSADIPGGSFAVGTSTLVVKDGKVGIGTTGPVSKLQINDNAVSADVGAAGIILRNAAALDYLNLWNYGGNVYAIESADENTYRALALQPHGGMLGIGTTAPDSQLHAQASYTGLSSLQQAHFRITDGAINTDILLNQKGSVGGYTDFGLINAKAGGTSVFYIRGDGNIGIGTAAPGSKLDVNGQIRSLNGTAAAPSFTSSGENNAGLFFGDDGVGSYLGLSAAGSEGMRLTRTGNVGIGTASPAAKLDVQGTVRQGSLTTYVRTINAGAAPAAFNILRQFHDSVNWGVGGILIEEFSYSYDASRFDYGMYFARYGYSGNTADILTKIGGAQLPVWGAATQVSGVYYYRDLAITVPAYYSITVRITSPIGITTDLSGAQANVVYLY